MPLHEQVEATGQGGDGRWCAAGAVVGITPERPLPLAGFRARRGTSTGIADPLEANLLLLTDLRTGERVLLASFDLLYVGPQLRALLAERLVGRLREDQLFTAASHTHTAPATDAGKPRLGAADPAYVEVVASRVAEAALCLLDGSPGPEVTLRLVRGRAGGAVNRRSRRWGVTRRGLSTLQLAPDEAGPRDETLVLIEARRADGSPAALLWSYACHPVGFPARSEVSADFPGVVRARLRKGAELPVLFLQGFTGDVRPDVRDRARSLRARARRLVNGPQFGLFDEARWRTWADGLAAAVEGAREGDPTELLGPLRLARRVEPLRRLMPEAPAERTVSWQSVALDPGLVLVGISAEPVTSYGGMLPAGALPVGYIDDVFGYLPTDAMLAEGGYEVDGFLEDFGLSGGFQPHPESWFRAGLKALEEAGAAGPGVSGVSGTPPLRTAR